MITLLNVLYRARRPTVQALQILKTGTRIFCHLSVDLLATSALDVDFNVALVYGGDLLVLQLALQDQILLTTKVALDVQFGLDKVEDVLWLPIYLFANLVEVLPRRLGC